MIKLVDLIKMAGIKFQVSELKIHCATAGRTSPLEAFFEGKFKEWQEQQNQKNFERKYILSLVSLGNFKWLFAGIYEVEGVPRYGKWEGESKPCYRYMAKELAGLEHLIGKAIIMFKKEFRASYLKGENYVDKLVMVELRPQKLTIGDFPGFKSVLLSYRMLKTVVRESNSSWSTVLSNVAGVYLIADVSSGKCYIGSAYGGEGIWQRWTVYANNGHGGNNELKDINPENFQFSLLEVCDIGTKNEDVIERESHWKKVLLTREYGLNKN